MTFTKKRYINLEDGQVHCRISGDLSAGVPLLCLHQTASSSEMFEHLMQLIAPFVSIVAIDTPGYGQSFRPEQPVSIAYFAQITRQCLEGLGVERCYVFGHHTGAAIAVQLVHDAPEVVDRLILGGPPLLSDEQKQKLKATLKARDDDIRLDDIEHTWKRIASRTLHEDSQLILREVLATLNAGDYASTYQAVFEHDFGGQLSAITCPTLVICGEHDTIRASAEPTHQAIKHSKLKIIEGAGTYMCDEHAQEVSEILLDFLQTKG